ncbi:MAG: diacylglycerol kinase family lipid kinase [Proteobacteria bacterium]|nr:diacylglycerol kinase family lipid kinase [Pseudomonadota bacterium]
MVNPRPAHLIEPDRWAYIVNPVAGNGRAFAIGKELALAAGAAGFGGPVHETMGPGHATDLAASAVRQGANIIAVIGGDGTVSEVAEALVGTDTCLLVLPGGGGNDLAGELGIDPIGTGPVSLARALRILANAPRIRHDVITLNGRACVQAGGTGLDAYVARLREVSKIRPAALAYGVGTIQGILTYRPTDVKVTVDGTVVWNARAYAVTIANIGVYGGGLRIVPDADPTDGLIDVAIIGDIHRLEAIRIFPKVYRGTHVGHPQFHLHRGRHVTVTTNDQPQPVHIDGTLTGMSPIIATIEGRTVLVAAPSARWVKKEDAMH